MSPSTAGSGPWEESLDGTPLPHLWVWPPNKNKPRKTKCSFMQTGMGHQKEELGAFQGLLEAQVSREDPRQSLAVALEQQR